MEKLFLMIVLLSAQSTLLLGAESFLDVKKTKYHGWGERNLAYNQQIEIVNKKNLYKLNLLQNKPGPKGQTYCFINLSVPEWYGFGRVPSNFFDLKINGISLKSIYPTKEPQIWKKENSAGATFILNFDGAKILLNVYMEKDSPLLWLTLKQPETQITPIKKAELKIKVVISKHIVKNRKTVWGGAYKRQGKTATRFLEQQKKEYLLKPEDKYIIFSDAILDGSNKDKGYGPCFLTFNFKDIQKASLNLQDSWLNSIKFELKPNFKEVTVAICQYKNRMSNQEFMKKFKNTKDSFIIH